MVGSKSSLFAIGALLTCFGVGVGVLASSVTSSSIRWSPPSRFHSVDAQVGASRIDQGAAGQTWARSAFSGGLRRCPEMNADFLSACEAEMKALAERPELAAGSYGGPLLITKVETAAVEPGIEPYTPAIDRTEDSAPLHEAAYRAEVDAEVTERTPDNYPAADEVQVGRGADGTPIAF